MMQEEEYKRLVTVLDSIENLIYVADMDTYEVLFINAWGKKTHGDVTGKKCWEVFQEGMNGPCSFCTNDKLVDAEGRPTELYKWEKFNGKYNKWYYCHDRAIEWGDGRLVRLEIAIDITEQKRIEEELRIQRQAMDSSVNAIALADMQGKLTYINPSFLSMWGYKHKKEVLGHSVLDFWYDKDKAKAVVDAIMEKDHWTGELVSKKKDGQLLDLYLSASLVYDIDGTPNHMMASFIDITERKLMERQIRESEEKHRRLFETMAQGVIYQAADSTIISANPAAERILGLSFQEMQGKTSMDPRWQMIKADGSPVPGMEHPAMMALRTGKKVGPVVRGVYHPDKNRHVWLNIIAIPLFQPGETEPFQAYATFEDITEQKQIEESLQEKTSIIDSLLQSTPTLITVLDNEGKYIMASDTIVNIIGREKREIIGKHFDELLPQEAVQGFKQNMEKLKEVKQPFIVVDNIMVGNQERVFETLLFPIQIKENIVELIGGIATDITEQVFDKEQIQKYTTELELRNLELNSVYGYLDSEIEKAMEIHKRSLPQTLPQDENLIISAFYQPAEKVGGDFYSTIKTGNKLITYLSDVTGHGLESALLSSFIKDMINAYVQFTSEEDLTSAGILKFLHEQYKKENFPEDYFLSIYLTVLDLTTLEIEYLGAGFQDSPLVFSEDNDLLELKNSGLPISSVFSQDQLNFNTKRMTLVSSSTILFNTDGITEQFVGARQYGERLHEVFYKNGHHPPDIIVEAIKEDFKMFNNGSLKGADDITLLVMRVG